MFYIYEKDGVPVLGSMPKLAKCEISHSRIEINTVQIPDMDWVASGGETEEDRPMVDEAQEVQIPAVFEELSGQTLFDWMATAGKLPFDTTTPHFIIPTNQPAPAGHFEVTDWSTSTWIDKSPVIIADMVRAECGQRILSTYPQYKQDNDQQDLTSPYSTGLPSLLTLVEGGNADAEQQAIYDAIQARVKFRVDLVWCSNQMEPDPPQDYSDDTRWDRTNWDENGNYTNPA